MGQLFVIGLCVGLTAYAALTAAVFIRANKLREIHGARDAAALADFVASAVPSELGLHGTWLLMRGRVLRTRIGMLAVIFPAPVALVLVDDESLYLAEPTLRGGRCASVSRAAGPLAAMPFGMADPDRTIMLAVVVDSGPYKALAQLGWLPTPDGRS